MQNKKSLEEEKRTQSSPVFYLCCSEMEMFAQDQAFIWEKIERRGLGEVRDSIELPGATEMPSGL